MDEINFSKPRIILYNWFKEAKEQIYRLKFYRDVEMQIYRKMKINLFKKGITAVKASQYLKLYNGHNTGAEKRLIRKDAIAIVTFLCYSENQMDREFELYRRGSYKYREKVEEKWLRNVVCTG